MAARNPEAPFEVLAGNSGDRPTNFDGTVAKKAIAGFLDHFSDLCVAAERLHSGRTRWVDYG